MTLPKLFTVLSHRYASRQGGYTRVHRYGFRKGDHAPSAILELVDGPNDLRFNMAAKIAGRELASLVRKDASTSATAAAIKRWLAQSGLRPQRTEHRGIADSTQGASTSPSISSTAASPVESPPFSLDGLPEVYKLLSQRTQDSIVKALRFRQASPSSPLDSATASQTPLQAFEALVRDSYFRASVLSKVPAWEVDPDKLDALQAASGNRSSNSDSRASTSRIPLTLPGRGRKLWAGQEGSNPHERILPADHAVEQETGVTQEEHEAALQQATQEEEEAQRLQAALLQQGQGQRKARHANSRNGAGDGIKQRHSRPSALGRAKGQLAPAKGLKEFRVTARAELPRAVTFRSHRPQQQHQAAL